MFVVKFALLDDVAFKEAGEKLIFCERPPSQDRDPDRQTEITARDHRPCLKSPTIWVMGDQLVLIRVMRVDRFLL